MALYSYKLKEHTDLCHFIPSSTTDFGVQCTVLREGQNIKEYTGQHYNIIKTLFEGRQHQDVALLVVTQPGKSFEHFDHEKFKLALVPKAYFRVLEFFQTEWPLVYKRIESDFQNMKGKKEWLNLIPTISFKGPADIQYQLIVDSTDHVELVLKVTKSHELGKTNITLCYSDEHLGSIHLPPLTMVKLAQDRGYLNTLFNYKETLSTKKSRQS